MKEPTPNTPAGEPEETLVTPRFDEVETVQAQPVVPLAEVPAGASRGRRFAARRLVSLPVALVLVSALVGVVVGGAGLYFYQHRSNEDTTADTQTPTASAEAPTAAPSLEESASAPPQAAEPKATDAAEVVSAEIVEPEAPSRDAKKEEADKSPAPEPRKAAERDDDNDDSGKRGKKGERDSEAARRTPRAERVGSREQARGDDGDGEPEARLSDEIIYRRERRAERQAERRERRANRQRSVDRVRGIFEGQPE